MEEYRLRVFENRVLRRIFGPKRDEVKGGWRKLHNEELHDFYSSPSIIKSRSMRWAGHIAQMGAKRIHIGYQGRQKEREDYKDKDKVGWIILKWILEIGWGGIDWIDLAQNRDKWRALVYMAMNLRVP